MIALKPIGIFFAVLFLPLSLSFATSITESDSTQPRGSAPGINDDGQNWADRDYTFTVPANARGDIKVEAKLMYKTFSNHYVAFLAEKDTEATVSNGGYARDLPTTGSMTSNPQHWGEALYEIYDTAGHGPAVQFARKKTTIRLRR
ncbi:MAG: hypothetical protein KZQ73_16060 [Candidatus Thiodiazotropha sp. (ex Semelilucina semeliformis)]|nr:hypothetical protein [Candidatus Thiodiazotropha sp. (ex Semelilucina semeliformis)]